MTATSSVISLAAAPSAAPGWGPWWTPAGCRVAIPVDPLRLIAVVVEEQLVVVDVGVVEGHPQQRPRSVSNGRGAKVAMSKPRHRKVVWTLGGRW